MAGSITCLCYRHCHCSLYHHRYSFARQRKLQRRQKVIILHQSQVQLLLRKLQVRAKVRAKEVLSGRVKSEHDMTVAVTCCIHHACMDCEHYLLRHCAGVWLNRTCLQQWRLLNCWQVEWLTLIQINCFWDLHCYCCHHARLVYNQSGFLWQLLVVHQRLLVGKLL